LVEITPQNARKSAEVSDNNKFLFKFIMYI